MNLVKFVLTASTTAAVFGLVVACSSSSGSGEPTPTANDGSTSATTVATECRQCVNTACTNARTVCDAEPSCATHSACVEKCAVDARGLPDSKCVEACPKAEGTAATKGRMAIDSCTLDTGPKSCASCGGTTGDAGASPIVNQTCGASTETNACFKCEDEKCCNTFKACADNPACKQQLQPCLVACKGDDKCLSGCYAQFPQGVAAWAARNTCNQVNCGQECNNGTPYDECLSCGIKNECRDTFVACHADESCFLIDQCITETCPDVTETCLAQCGAKGTPEAKKRFDAWAACVTTVCSAACSK